VIQAALCLGLSGTVNNGDYQEMSIIRQEITETRLKPGGNENNPGWE